MITWFIFSFLQILMQILYAIGVSSLGGAGFILMVENFKNGNIGLGVIFALSSVLWTFLAIYHILLLNNGRKEYREMGGHKKTIQEVGNYSFQTAYDNRDSIKQIVIDNKEPIQNFAKEHKEDIIQISNENKDILWENRDIVASVFDNSTLKK
jgi:hypothetical protein